MNDLVIDIKNLSRRFGDKHALQDVTLRVPRGGVFGLIGSNGAGKTTLIKHILGSHYAQSGSVSYVLAVVSYSLMMSFVFSNSAISVVPSLLRIDHWIWPMLVMAVLLAIRTPLDFSLSAGLCVFALVALIYSTIRSVIDRDASVGTASLIWLVGIAFAVGLMALLRNELGPVGMLLTGSLVGLAMLPFFSTTAGLCRARTT